MRFRRLINEEEEIFHIPSLDFVNGNWNTLVQFLEYEGFPKWSFGDDLNFKDDPNLTSLYNLTRIEGYLELKGCKNLKSIGPLEYVGSFLDLEGTSVKSLNNLEHVGSLLGLNKTDISSFGKLKYVGGDLYLNKILSLKHSEDNIRSRIDVKREIYLE